MTKCTISMIFSFPVNSGWGDGVPRLETLMLLNDIDAFSFPVYSGWDDGVPRLETLMLLIDDPRLESMC